MNGAEVLTRFTADTSGVDKATKNTSASLGKLASAFTLGNVAASAINKTLQTFTSNLDSAIARYDTMNNFPKVMKNLGISADDANEAVNILSEKLKGLPTTLDQATMSVQRLTTKTGDVKESTELFLALNNAILAGGANAQTQSAALEQMSQAIAKGKPDMMEWRSMLTAMPAQLTQIAKAMGYVDVASLGSAVRSSGGEEEFSRLLETMKRLNTEGIDGLGNFEEQARAATGGIAVSITNMKTATARGISNMITKINEALEPFGGLSGVISNLGKVAEKAFSAIGDVLGSIIPKLIEVANWFKDNIGVIKGVAIAVGSLALAWKGIELMSFIQQAGGVVAALGKITTAIFGNIAAKIADKTETAALNVLYAKDFVKNIAKATAGLVKNTAQFVVQKGAMIATTVATKAMAAAQWLLNAAMNANPIGLIIAGVVALVAGIVLLWNKCEWFRNLVMTIFEAIKTGLQAVITFFQPVIDFVYNCFIAWAAIFFTFWETIFNFLKTVGIWIYENVITPVVNFAVGLFETIKNAFIAMWEWIVGVFNTIVEFVKTVFEIWWNIFSTFWTTIFNFLSTVATWVYDNVLSPVINFFSNVFNTIWNIVQKVVDKIKSAFNAAKEAIITAFKAVKETLSNIFNTIGNIIKTPINGIIGGINKVIDKINGLKVPDWVPGIGGKSPNFGRIPALATGTNYVPEDTLAMIHKGEAVVPKKFNPYANGLDNSTIGNMQASKQNIIVNVEANFETDPLGQVVRNIKTFSGGAKNDYNYGMGGSRLA